jgi:hypothetical protein
MKVAEMVEQQQMGVRLRMRVARMPSDVRISKREDLEKRKRKLSLSERPRRVFGIGPKSIEWERKEGG